MDFFKRKQVNVGDTLKSINSDLKSAGGHYSTYSCKTVSWDDVQRGTVGGGLSCWGSNITDTRLYAKDGRSLFTVRGDNWNERLGKVSVDQLAVVANDTDGGGGTSLQPYTLRTFLNDPSRFGKYANLNISSLSDETLDSEVSVRFQTTFLPVEGKDKGSLEFCPEAYNYNTRSDSDPRNLVLLCTTQGLAVQQDGSGAKKLFHHARVDGKTKRYYLEAESSNHKVGGSQTESVEEKEDALARGKATASVIGVAGMGTRFNVLMTIQIPLKQKEVVHDRSFGGMAFGSMDYDDTLLCSGGLDEELVMAKSMFQTFSAAPKFKGGVRKKSRTFQDPSRGRSSAARVSKGTYFDDWNGLSVKDPERHPNEHITVTIVMYYTCSGGVPTADDVKAAVDDLEDMYKTVESGKLADATFDFMKSELTVKDSIDIETKLQDQPPPVDAPSRFNIFPRSK